MEDKIVDLEVRIAYQDKLIAELDSVVVEFTRRLEVLERQVSDLRESAAERPVGPSNEAPPHY
jgi:SlyX protein